MNLKQLLSIATAALTALGAVLYSMGGPHAWPAVGLWIAAVLSLVVTDFLGALRLPRGVGTALMWCALVVFLLQYLLQALFEGGMLLGHSPDKHLQTVANVLIFLQCVLLFQEKDARAYGWLTVMSLLQVVVAARYSRGFAFGSLLVVYSIVGIFGLSLLTLFGQRKRAQPPGFSQGNERHPRREKEHLAEREEYVGRWPLAGVKPELSSAPPGGGSEGVVLELFGRLTLLIVGGLLLATVIFYTTPRPRIPSWRGRDDKKTISVVGFNDKIELGQLGDTIESREEVMRVRLLDPSTRQPYTMRDHEIYLRGTAVARYSQGQWRRLSANPAEQPESAAKSPVEANAPVLRIGSPVLQQSTLEPYLERRDLFFIWPLIEPVDEQQGILCGSRAERLERKPHFHYEAPLGGFSFEVLTSGLTDGRQAALVPARYREQRPPLLQMPDDGKSLPRLRALAARWQRDSGLKPDQHKELAEYFERQLSSSGQFHYSLQAAERDESIDPIEDFVSNHRRGHCEYFATALALMLRSQGIPSRVILGYRCDEWDAKAQCFQVRQLHAHAWVEAFLDPPHVPQSLRRENPLRWSYGGWLRLDGTPSDDLGSTAANRTTLGAWEARWHGLQHYWERYIADMDNKKQQESVYEPIRKAWREFTNWLVSPSAWREMAVAAWGGLARMLRSGIMGKLVGTLLLIVVAAVTFIVGRWLWRKLAARFGRRAANGRTSVEFYRRFEYVAARCGLFRRVGQTPREFAATAGGELAKRCGKPELAARAMQVAEAFYCVRFGRKELDAAAAAAVERVLEEIKVVSHENRTGRVSRVGQEHGI